MSYGLNESEDWFLLDLRNESEEVKWAKVIWFSQNIPKRSFILWLAVQNKLMTHDRIAKWGNYNMNVCALCLNEEESHKHLFFNCPFSKDVWDKLKSMMNVQILSNDWNEIIKEMADKPCNNSIWSIVRRLCIAAAVYGIWKERNSRIFRNESCNGDTVFGKTCDHVRNRLLSLKAKHTSAICQVEQI